jgi:hypothetical protein
MKIVTSGKVLLVGIDTAGFLSGLEAGLRGIGYEVTRCGPIHEFGYSKNESPVLKIWRKYFSLGFARKKFRSFDIVVYNHGESITGKPREFRLMRMLGKKLVFVFHGSDVRPAYLNGAIWQRGGVGLGAIRKLVKYQKRIVRDAEKFADLIVCWSGITHFFSRRVVLHEHIGFPLSSWAELRGVVEKPNSSDTKAGVVRVLHSPSSTAAKGTVDIESVISSLQSDGLPISYERLSGVSNSDVLEKLTNVDFVVDQLYADTAGGVFAAESSLLGKAVVVGVIDKNWLSGFLGASTPPTCLIDPIDLKQEVRKLFTDVEYRSDRATAAKAHFEHLWNPENVARNYVSLLHSKESANSGVNPHKIHQARGGYATVAQISKKVTDYTRRFGVKALGLGHNLMLEEQVLKSYFLDSGGTTKISFNDRTNDKQ